MSRKSDPRSVDAFDTSSIVGPIPAAMLLIRLERGAALRVTLAHSAVDKRRRPILS